MNVLRAIYFSFPIQLIVNHLKKNQVLLLFWAILYAVILGDLGQSMGVPYLFLDPEYLGDINFRSLFIVGVFFGTFSMAFNITCYILDGHRFSFIGHLPKPFTKFSINNSLFSILFLILFLYRFVDFQFQNSHQSVIEIIKECLGFLAGCGFTIFITHLYFRFTNKDIFRYIAGNMESTFRKSKMNRVNVINEIGASKKGKYRVDYYFDLFKIKKVDRSNKYDKTYVLKVFDQNHLNAIILELIAFIVIIILGFFKEVIYFQIPASASVLLLFSILMMFTGAFSYWLRGWSISVLLILFLILNFLVVNNLIISEYYANGMNYAIKPAEYSLESLYAHSNDVNYLNDIKHTEERLNNWRKKFPKDKKPKMVLLGVSGGGQRAASWTFSTIQFIDSTLNNNFMKQTTLITGASGGIMGASYYRELYLRKLTDNSIKLEDTKYYKNITKDMLNPVIFSFVASDIFFKSNSSPDSNMFCKDRGYALEQALNINTEYVLDKKLTDYSLPEYEGKIPAILMTPTILNDGRRLYIASQPVSYMTTLSINNKLSIPQNIKGIEFSRFFAKQNAANLSYLSALRMNASFPYVTPNLSLPSEPRMQVMDAGLTDNFGFTDAARFLYVFRKWISENTSGVIFVSIRDTDKHVNVEKKNTSPSIMDRVFNPIGSILINWAEIQDFKNDDFVEYVKTSYKGNLHVVDFEYVPQSVYWTQKKDKDWETVRIESKRNEQRAALSWHLTQKEKESIRGTIFAARNQASLKKLKKLLEE